MTLGKKKRMELRKAIEKYRIEKYKELLLSVERIPADFFWQYQTYFPEYKQLDGVLSEFYNMKNTKGIVYQFLLIYRQILELSGLCLSEYMDESQIKETNL